MFRRKDNAENEEQSFMRQDTTPEMDPDVSFPDRPPVEILPGGIFRENEPGSTDDLDGRVERLGVMDDGQYYLLSLSGLWNLFDEYHQDRMEQVHEILGRTRIKGVLADQIRSTRTPTRPSESMEDY